MLAGSHIACYYCNRWLRVGVWNNCASPTKCYTHSSFVPLSIQAYFSFMFLYSARTSSSRSYKTAFIRWLTKLPTVSNQAPVLVRNDFRSRSCSRPRKSNGLRKRDSAAEEGKTSSETVAAGQRCNSPSTASSPSHRNIPQSSDCKKNEHNLLKERGKRPLSNTREKQSPHLSKAVCRGESVVEETSSNILSPSPFLFGNQELKLSDPALQQNFPAITLIPEQDSVMEKSLQPLGKKLVLPKLRLREKVHRESDTGTNIFKHRMMKRTTVTSIKRTTVLNSKVIRRKTSLEKVSD